MEVFKYLRQIQVTQKTRQHITTIPSKKNEHRV